MCLVGIMAVVFGLVFGSFANVVIWRLPRGESLSHPPSRCPACDTPVAWRDNIPVLSWLLLRGRCRSCAAPISPRYPIVEALVGMLWLHAVLAFGLTPRALVAAIFAYLLVILAFIDLDTMRLPNALVALLAGFGALGVATSAVTGTPVAPLVDVPGLGGIASAAIGVALGGGAPLAIAAAYAALRGKKGMGMGDVKLLAAMGLYLGPYVALSLFAGSVLGLLATPLAGRRGARDERIPFGPFLALGGYLSAYWGPAAVIWYLGLL